MSATHWVVGSRGLLGSALVRRLHAEGQRVIQGPRVRWTTPDAASDLAEGLRSLVGEAGKGEWFVAWCAGVGVTGTGEEALAEEVSVFRTLVDSIAALPVEVRGRGRLFVASSAGGVYGGAHGAPFDEESPVAPLGHYGAAKIALEDAARRLFDCAAVPVLVGRIANLYGPGQSLEKPQGLISHLCLASVGRKPISIYVSMDTRRDYLYADDCARLIVDAGRRLAASGGFHVKILASGRSVTVGDLLGEFRHVVGRKPDIIMATSPYSALQSLDLRMRSTHWTDLDRQPTTNLADGMARTLHAIRRGLFGPRT